MKIKNLLIDMQEKGIVPKDFEKNSKKGLNLDDILKIYLHDKKDTKNT